jgi:hypothetical protein
MIYGTIYDIWYDIWYGMIWYMVRYMVYGMIYDMVWYDIWYDIWYMVWYMIWYMIWYMVRYMIYGTIWHDMIWYDVWYGIWYMIRYMVCYMIWFFMIIIISSMLHYQTSVILHAWLSHLHNVWCWHKQFIYHMCVYAVHMYFALPLSGFTVSVNLFSLRTVWSVWCVFSLEHFFPPATSRDLISCV